MMISRLNFSRLLASPLCRFLAASPSGTPLDARALEAAREMGMDFDSPPGDKAANTGPAMSLAAEEASPSASAATENRDHDDALAKIDAIQAKVIEGKALDWEEEEFLSDCRIKAWNPALRQHTGAIPCYCGFISEAKTVSKEGPNTGRQFYPCPVFEDDREEFGCKYNFFMWDDQPATPIGPKCRHGIPTQMREVQKEGPNKGRFFFSCRYPQDKGSCNFFEWASPPQA
eukprot:g3073.t1